MKEKIENAISLLGEVKDGIGFDQETEHAQELVNSILESLDELEFILEDKN